MAFTLFNFTKSWRNAGDFPTFEPDEAKVRDDLQSLFDELKAGLNRLIGEIKANNVPFTPTAEVDSSDVQNAIENVQSQIASAILGELPDGSVTTAKLGGSAVTAAKIADGAVTAGKIASGVIPGPSSSAPKMDGTAAQGTQTAFARGDHVHPKDSTKADLSGGKVLPTQLSKSRVNVTASRDLALTDDGKLLYVSSGSGITVTIPVNSEVQLPVGAEILVYRAGAGAVTVAAASGVTMQSSAAAYNALKRYDYAILRKLAANTWSVDFVHELADGAVTDGKLASNSVNSGNIKDGAVTSGKIADGAVGTGKIDDGAVTRTKVSNDVLFSPVKDVATTPYYISDDDFGKTLRVTANSDVTINFPGSMFSSLPSGTEIAIIKWVSNDTTKITFVVDSDHYLAMPGVNGKGGRVSMSMRYGMMAIKKVTNSSLIATGNIDWEGTA